MFSFRHDNWEDFDKHNFEGWPEIKNEIAKIKLYQMMIHAYKQEIIVQQNTLNFLKQKTTLEKIIIEYAINKIPCFTTNLIKAAQFITEYAQDSDDENSEVISDGSDLDNNSVFTDDVSRCTSPSHTNQTAGIWDEYSLNSHQIDPVINKDSEVPDNSLLANSLVNKFTSNIDGLNIDKQKTSSENSNNTEDSSLKVKQKSSNNTIKKQGYKTTQANMLFELNEESCNLLTIHNSNISELESSSTVERAFICDYCKRGFIAKETLRKHIKICPKRNDGWGVKPKVRYKERNLSFPCRICNIVFRRKGNLDRHNKSLHGILKRFRCSICRWTFYNNEALHYHCITKHGLSKKDIFACAFCSNKFKKLRDLRNHSRSHGSKQSYVCFVCFKSSRNKAIYQQHKSEHGMSCEICSFRTNTEEEMNDHVLSHLQTVIFNCGICSRTFKRRNGFKRHIKTHWMEQKDDDSC